MTERRNLLAIIGPGMLVAATGVGAGDLASAAFAGSNLGLAVLWAVVLGAFIKFVVSEGLARYQLTTGQTLLEGAVIHLGRPVQWFFLVYLLVWTFGVGTSLTSACGVAAHAVLPVFEDARDGKNFFGVVHSIAGLLIVLVGGFRAFGAVMNVLVGVMFIAVVGCAVLMKPDWSAALSGLLVPRVPEHPEGLAWTLALMGGVGGTLTIMCYGYWIREAQRTGGADLRICRIDLGVAYAMTAVFGLAMVSIGSRIPVTEDGGTRIAIMIGNQLGEHLGQGGRIAFLVGAWAAVFTSLLGVWQSAPYLFADFWDLFRHGGAGRSAEFQIDRRSWPYRGYLIAIATVPLVGLTLDFKTVQKVQSIFGAMVMPMLALTLLMLCTRGDLLGNRRNRMATTLALIGTLVFFGWLGFGEIAAMLQPAGK